MKLLLIAIAFAISCAVISGKKTKYTNKYDNMDLDEILDNRRLLVSYIKCVLDLGKCTAEGRELKSHISDALQTGCTKCTPNQKYGARRVIAHLIKKEPDYWNQLVEKYDSKKVYSTKYEEELNSLDEE